MPSIRLTQLAVDRLATPATGRVVYWDRVLPGFGLRVTEKGARSWIAQYRVGGGRSGRTVTETLGSFSTLPKVEAARELARSSMQKAASGTNPVEERKADAARAITVQTAVERYLTECDRNLKPKTAKEWRRIYSHDVLPRWGDRPLAQINKGDVLALVNDKATKRERNRQGLAGGAAVQAGKMLTRLRTFFGWAVANDLAPVDPTAGVRKPAKEASRDRILTDAEIAAFWAATEGLGFPFAPLFRVMLLTAQRESEVAGMCWSELDLTEATWTIPAARSKNSKPHIVHLSPAAVLMIEQLPRIADQDLLFSVTGSTPPTGFARAKRRLDGLMLANMGEGTDLSGWVLHDLRRTATTCMARLGVLPHVADKVLNHTAGTIRGVGAIYNRFSYIDERRDALDRLGASIERLVNPQDNVVRLRRS